MLPAQEARIITDRLRLFVVFAAGVALAFVARRTSMSALVAVFAAINLRLLLLAAPPLLALNLASRAARFGALLSAADDRRAAGAEVLASVLVSQAANNVLPLRRGDLLRTRDFVARGHPRRGVVSAQLTEKSLELASLLAWTVPLVAGGPLARRPGVALTLVGAALLAPLAWLFWRGRPPRDRARSAATSAPAPRELPRVARALACAWLADALALALIFACLASLHIGGGWRASAAVLAGINLAIAFPAAPANLGTFEAGAALGLVLVDVPADEALAFALLYRAVQWAPFTVAGGLVAWMRDRARKRARPPAPAVCGAILLLSLGSGARDAAAAGELHADVRSWRLIPRESGPQNYYRVVNDPAFPYIHADYRPGYETAVMGFDVPSTQRRAFHHVTWDWRADVLPRGGNECAKGKEDSAAVVYVTWKRGLRWYSLKYVWSAVGVRGAVCDTKRSLFVAQDTIILETGGPLEVWRTEEVDLDSQFRAHFGDQEIPELQGIGLMTDGDQTQSASAADYGGFVLSP